MDRIDEQILELMKGNARITFRELGKALGMSRVAAAKRVRKLEVRGIIRGYNTAVHTEGETTMLIDIVTRPGCFEKVLEYVSLETAFVRQIYHVGGGDIIHIVAVSADAGDLEYLTRMIRKECGEDIMSISCHVVSEIIKDVYGGVRYDGTKRKIQKDEGDI